MGVIVMTFVKGQSGNPAGRRPGSRNKATAIMDQVTDRRLEEVVNAVMGQAYIGNGAAIRAVFDRLYPKRRGAPIAFALPPVRTAADVPIVNAAIWRGQRGAHAGRGGDAEPLDPDHGPQPRGGRGGRRGA
jgi:hypothetical protein